MSTAGDSALPAAETKASADEDGGPSPSRTLALSLARVEVRMYRRSRTMSDVIRKPAEFEYIIRCRWTGQGKPRSPRRPAPTSPRSTVTSPRLSPTSPRSTAVSFFGRTGSMTPVEGKEEFWWETLPENYVVRRNWSQLTKLHEAIVNDLAFDAKDGGRRRVKAQVPGFPVKGDLHQFLLGVAATGDVAAMSRSGPASLTSMGSDTPHFDLDVMHTIYAENRLGPYFQAISEVLRELPAEVLQGSCTLRRFCTFGVKTFTRANPATVKKRFCGPQPVVAKPEDIAAAARHLRQTGSLVLPGSLARPARMGKSCSTPSLVERPRVATH
eukprot:TRINITY_DN16177_c0_g1_i1.p1 TRINITY_DN16177_c0_g1~~TRINITY_DN16177_c0_g1_i1.p1  ORF type:complete len:327 (-),score=39.48 TRINITY_DN16177_c0_g1_i1:98-1078(-)